jgi:hypothetical protein
VLLRGVPGLAAGPVVPRPGDGCRGEGDFEAGGGTSGSGLLSPALPEGSGRAAPAESEGAGTPGGAFGVGTVDTRSVGAGWISTCSGCFSPADPRPGIHGALELPPRSAATSVIA